MDITSSDLRLIEYNKTLGLVTEVFYFTIPNSPFAALARGISIQNISNKPIKLQLLDGLPQIVPYGVSNLFLKKLGRTIEAWMHVKNLEHAIAFYKLDVDPTDRPEVIKIEQGNFYLSFHKIGNKIQLIRPFVDPVTIFGPISDFSYPYNFIRVKELPNSSQEVISSRTPAAFSYCSLALKKDETHTLYSLIGQIRSMDLLNSLAPNIANPEYISQKYNENKRLICELQNEVATKSSCQRFDLYVQQTYLDNIIRGGYPLRFRCGSTFYLYSRKHGDLERDYNKFHIQPAYYSQGNGNYRDINQNRRSDIWFNPDIKEENLVYFLNLIQLDGFNPLVVKGVNFRIVETDKCKEVLSGLVCQEDIPKMMEILKNPFTPGDLILTIETQGLRLNTDYDNLLENILSFCQKSQEAEHGEGFWTDHWTYNLDLLESYFGLYPEQKNELLFEKNIFTFFDNSERVKPRSEKYMLVDGKVRQYRSLISDSAKKELIRKRLKEPHLVRTEYGKGEIYYSCLFDKLLCLLANKLASLDPFGIGIEMEADKPNWYDALNGLPGLLGSSLNETLELKRLIILLKEVVSDSLKKEFSITEEVAEFLDALNAKILDYRKNKDTKRDYVFWDESHTLKEDFYVRIRFGVSGRQIRKDANWLNDILMNALEKIEEGIAKAKVPGQELYYSYFINEVKEYTLVEGNLIRPLGFNQTRLPLFLEGQMHALRVAGDVEKARSIYKSTRKSYLFDKKLKMYKVTGPLKDMPQEIGRCRVFTPGWLENESIWLHMEYKYLLEVLKNGLYKEFYEGFRNILIPFQNPNRYGRSILENCSFLVSSAFPDKRLHGNGFVARLSGATAELLQIWLIMNVGPQPFRLNKNNELNLCLNPILAGWLFNQRKKTYSFNFLSKVEVVYHNPKLKDTFGKNRVSVTVIKFTDKDGNLVTIQGNTIPTPYAEQIRLRQIIRIDAELN